MYYNCGVQYVTKTNPNNLNHIIDSMNIAACAVQRLMVWINFFGISLHDILNTAVAVIAVAHQKEH
jgi:hypothetical protein